MAKQKKEDNRDIFETALDVALPTTAALGGAMLGGKMARAASGFRNPKKVSRELEEAWSKKPLDKDKIARLEQEARFTGIGLPYVYGGVAGASAGAQSADIYLRELKKKRRK